MGKTVIGAQMRPQWLFMAISGLLCLCLMIGLAYPALQNIQAVKAANPQNLDTIDVTFGKYRQAKIFSGMPNEVETQLNTWLKESHVRPWEDIQLISSHDEGKITILVSYCMNVH